MRAGRLPANRSVFPLTDSGDGALLLPGDAPLAVIAFAFITFCEEEASFVRVPGVPVADALQLLARHKGRRRKKIQVQLLQ